MVVIAGSTGVGKTDLALNLGKTVPIEIINADTGQFYEPLTIGTAKPDWKTSHLQHHLFDIFTTPRSCTVLEYRKLLQNCLEDIWKRNKIPVIVGGSTFYIESIFFQSACVEKMHEPLEHALFDGTSLWQKLNAIDPQRAQEIHPHDEYRLKRALTVWNATGIKPSEQKPLYSPFASYWFFYVTRERTDLYNRIDQRCETMLSDGWVDEVSSLINTPWQPFIQQKKFIGYPELIDFIVQGKREMLWTACTHGLLKKQEIMQNAKRSIGEG